MTPTIEWRGDHIRIIEQTLLPAQLELVEIRDIAGAVDAIQRLAIRGAPALGVFGAYAVVVGLDEAAPRDAEAARSVLDRVREVVGQARPTAVNLQWGVDRVVDVARSASDPASIRAAAEREAIAVHEEDAAACDAIGEFGRALLGDRSRIGTHCNAGRLATGGIGTALAPIYAKHRAAEPVSVLATETRPLLQGARLTAWELDEAGVEVRVTPDGAMAGLILGGQLDAYIVGSDRIAANGDVANKVGTLAHALAAHEAGIPFYVAAPTSTVDLATASGESIEIEWRSPDEVHRARGERLTPASVDALNPAFDVTPARLVTAIITERGVCRAPFTESLAAAATGVAR